MFCPKCGGNIDDKAKFCNLCGANLSNIAKPSPLPSKPENSIKFKFDSGKIKDIYSGKNKKRNIIITASAAAAVIAIGVIGSVMSNPSNKIVSCTDDGSYSEAVDIFYNEYKGKYDKKLEKKLADCLSQCKDNLNSGKITLQEAEDIADTVYSISDSRNSEISDLHSDLYQLISSKRSFDNGKQYMDDKDYQSAIECFNNVISDDENYKQVSDYISECEESFKTDIFDSANSYAENGNYSEAINVLEKNSEYIKDDSRYNESIDGYYSKISDEAKKKIDNYFSSGNYSDACTYIDNLVSEYPNISELKNMQNSMKNNYVDHILNEAEASFNNKNYSEAVSTIEIGINQIGDDNPDLNNTYSEYKSYLPTYIDELEYLSCSRDSYDAVYLNENLKDNTGEEHRHSWCLYDEHDDYDWSKDLEDYAEYFLNGKYNTFSGKCGVSYERRSSDKSKYFDIYADGVLVYTSPTMISSSLPVDFSIDVTGVKVLKISYPPLSEHAGGNHLAVIYDGVFTRNEG